VRIDARRLTLALVGIIVALAALIVWRMPEVYAWRWYWTSGKPVMTDATLTLAAPFRWLDDYYAVADLGHGTYAIGEPRYGQCNVSYLILGTKQAVLFDTGPGLHDIRKVVLSLTALPVLAIPSHLHFDHVGNLSRFAAVALPDLPSLRSQQQGGDFALGMNQYLGFVEGFKRPTFHVTRWVAPDSEIDLGDRRLMLLSVPGHTAHSVVLLDHETNAMFAGDFIYPTAIYAFLPGANLRDYAASARRVVQHLDDSSTVYGGHGCEHLPNVDVPILHRSDVADLEKALTAAQAGASSAQRDWFPREIPVNTRMKLLAKYPWMSP
jgi:glyoxylase-like metal-dependent hydrolase (beta-lactamase superfamily II)